jgi:hypothetical protein
VPHRFAARPITAQCLPAASSWPPQLPRIPSNRNSDQHTLNMAPSTLARQTPTTCVASVGASNKNGTISQCRTKIQNQHNFLLPLHKSRRLPREVVVAILLTFHHSHRCSRSILAPSSLPSSSQVESPRAASSSSSRPVASPCACVCGYTYIYI